MQFLMASFLLIDLCLGDMDTSSSSDTSSVSSSDMSTELRASVGKIPDDVLALFVDDDRPAHGRRGKRLEPYQSITDHPSARPNQRQLDEAMFFTPIRSKPNGYSVKDSQRKVRPKELYQNNPSPVELTKAFQDIPYDDELLSLKHQGLAIPPFPGVNVLPLSKNVRAKDAKPNRGTPLNLEKDLADREKTYTLKKDQLLVLRARWSKKCDKAAAKECKKACKSAENTACSQYKCRKDLKRALKKECKKHCKIRFIERGSGCGR